MKIRKALILSIIASMLLGIVFATGSVGAQLTTIGVEPDEIITEDLVPGSSFTVNITVRDVADLAGVEFKLGYNTLALSILSVTTNITYGGIFGPTYFELINEINEADGYLHCSIMQMFGEPGFTGDGLAAIIDFTVDSVGESALNLYDTKLGDSDAVPINHDALDGYFRNTLEEIVYSATLARRRAWPEHHDYYLGKDEDLRNDLFAIVCNDGVAGVWVKVVFTVTDSTGKPLGTWETVKIPLMPGETFGHKKDARYMCPFPTPYPYIPPEVGKYYVSAMCLVDTNIDGIPDTAMGRTRSFSFDVFPEI